MKNITGWAAASLVIGILGACSVEVTDGGADGGASSSTSSTGSGSSGSAGSSSSSTATGTGGSTGGSGGSSGDGGMMCAQSATATACEKCAFLECTDETCACKSNTECGANMVAYWTCISMPNANLDSCAGTFAINSNGGDMTGASKANELAGCMADCENRCKGGDAG